MPAIVQSLIPFMVFIASMLVVFGVYMLFAGSDETGAEKVKSRIRRLSAAAAEEAESDKLISLARQEGVSSMDAALLRVSRLHNLDRFLEQSGVEFGPAMFVAMTFLVAVIGGSIATLISGGADVISFTIGFVSGALIPWFWLSRKRQNRLNHLVRQVPDTLDFFARSLRAGNPFSSAIKIASDEMPQPIAGELAITFDELNYGLAFEDAMSNMANRVEAEEVRLFITAVLVQKSTGGNLAELLNRIAKLLRERITAQGEIRVQASEMRASARVLIVLPFIVAGLLQLANPDYFPIMLESDMGRTMLIVQGVLMAVGYFIINRMVSFRV